MPQDEKKEQSALSRHPLTIVVIAFLLTGVLGVAFSQWLAGHQSEIERTRLELEARRAAVQNFSRDMYERRARAEMLASAFRRNAPLEEIMDRKRLYDEAYVRRNYHYQAIPFPIRDVLGET